MRSIMKNALGNLLGNLSGTALFAAFCSALLLAVVPTAVTAADQPLNIEPGRWLFDFEISMQGGMGLPGGNQTNEQCITPEDIMQNGLQMEDMEGCTMLRQEATRERFSYVMSCNQEGMQMEMHGDMRFSGTTGSGQINSRMDTPIGPMEMSIRIQGKRIGDC